MQPHCGHERGWDSTRNHREKAARLRTEAKTRPSVHTWAVTTTPRICTLESFLNPHCPQPLTRFSREPFHKARLQIQACSIRDWRTSAICYPAAEADDEAGLEAEPDNAAIGTQRGTKGSGGALNSPLVSGQHYLSSHQPERVTPCTFVTWKNLHLTKLTRALKRECFANQRRQQFLFGHLSKGDAVEFHHP